MRRPRRNSDLDATNARTARRRTRAQLWPFRYLRAPEIYVQDFTAGAGFMFVVTVAALLIVGRIVG